MHVHARHSSFREHDTQKRRKAEIPNDGKKATEKRRKAEIPTDGKKAIES